MSAKQKQAQEESLDVIHEEIITHPFARPKAGGWRAECRVMGSVKVRGELYHFDQIVMVRLRRAPPLD